MGKPARMMVCGNSRPLLCECRWFEVRGWNVCERVREFIFNSTYIHMHITWSAILTCLSVEHGIVSILKDPRPFAVVLVNY